MNETTKVPVSFWVVGAFALVWNILGFVIYYMQVSATPELLAQMYESEAELAFVSGIPAWATGAQGLAVTAGVLGSLLLLIRMSLAKLLFIASLAGILAQNVYGFIIGNGIEVFGATAIVLPVVVILIAVALIIYAGKAADKGWLR